jgi:hypothetical protein
LETHLHAGASLELLARWFMDVSEPVETVDVSTAVLGGDEFDLPENTLWRFRRAAEQCDAADKGTSLEKVDTSA